MLGNQNFCTVCADYEWGFDQFDYTRMVAEYHEWQLTLTEKFIVVTVSGYY